MAENNNLGKIARNTSFLTLAFIFQKIISFFYFAFIASSVGASNIGKYSWALFFTGIFAIFIDFGLGPVLTREISRDKEKAKEYLGNILSLKLLFTVVVLVAMYAILSVLGRDPLSRNLVFIATFIIILDSFTFTFYSIFRAYQVLKYEALGIVIYQSIIVLAGFFCLRSGLFLKALVGAILLGSIFNFFYSFILLIKKAKINWHLTWNKELIKNLLKIAAPFALAGIFVKFNSSIDTVLLGILTQDKYVGWYIVASKLNLSLTFLPGAFATSFFPAMSVYFITSRERLAQIFEKAMIYLMIVSLPITFGSIALADKIILKLYGKVFEPSIFAMQIIIIGLVFVFLNYPVGNLLNAANRQILNTVNVGLVTVFNVVANLIVIPKYNYLGAAFVSLTSAVLLLSLGLPWISRLAPYRKSYLFSKFLRILLAAFIMGVLLFYSKNAVSFILLLPLAIIFYFVFIYLLKVFYREDLREIISAIFKRTV